MGILSDLVLLKAASKLQGMPNMEITVCHGYKLQQCFCSTTREEKRTLGNKNARHNNKELHVTSARKTQNRTFLSLRSATNHEEKPRCIRLPFLIIFYPEGHSRTNPKLSHKVLQNNNLSCVCRSSTAVCLGLWTRLRVGVFKSSLDKRGTYEAMHGGKKEKQEEQTARSRTVIRGECGPRACDEGARRGPQTHGARGKRAGTHIQI